MYLRILDQELSNLNMLETFEFIIIGIDMICLP